MFTIALEHSEADGHGYESIWKHSGLVGDPLLAVDSWIVSGY